MIRVLHVFGSLARGGLETFVMNLYRSIDKRKVQFDFLLDTPGGEYESEAEKLGANIYYISKRNQGFLNSNKSICNFFKEHAHLYRAIHVHTSWLSSLTVLKYAKKYNIPTRIIHAHSTSIPKSLKWHHIHYLRHLLGKLRISNLATNFIGCSDLAIDWFYKNTPVYDKAIMISNGINVNSFKFNPNIRREVREELHLNNCYTLALVANLIPVKNHFFLIRVLAHILKRNSNVKLVLVGEGPLKDQILKMALDCNVRDDILLTGSRADINRLLQAFDMIVMPSLFEGLPVSLVEAQSAGLPIVASDRISRDVALTSNIKFLSLEYTPEYWAEEILKFKESYVRKDCTDIIVQEGFDIKSTAKQLLKIYTR